MNIIIERTIELNAPLLTEPLPGSLFTTESKAHQFLIACTQNGAPVTLSGTVSAKFIREANNTTILMSGSISGGKASLILPADCYNISGRFDLTIFVTSNNVTTCVYSATGSVKAAQDGTLVDEGTVVPSIEQLQQDVTNLENNKVNRSGDTMTGSLSVPGLNALGNYPGMAFRQSAGSTPTGYITENNATRRMYFTVVPTDAGGNEVYNLPAPSTGNTSQRNFDILTTKDWITPVSVTTGVSRVTVQYNNSFKFLGKLVVVNVRLLIAAGTAISVNSGVCNIQQAAYVPESPGDTGTYATISAAPYGPFKVSPNGTVTATVQIPADYTGTITMSGVFFAA